MEDRDAFIARSDRARGLSPHLTRDLDPMTLQHHDVCSFRFATADCVLLSDIEIPGRMADKTNERSLSLRTSPISARVDLAF